MYNIKKDNDNVLIVWLVVALIWDIFLIGGTSYLVFWKGYSGAWFILAIAIGDIGIAQALKKRYNLYK